jgi:hypothetical protein
VVAAGNAAEPKEIPMSKTKPKRRGGSRPTRNKANKQSNIARPASSKAASQNVAFHQATRQQHKSQIAQTKRRNSKQAQIIRMLQSANGTTIAAMMRATGWQQHSVRGFLAGVVRKKLGLNLVSAVTEGNRIYRIADKVTKPSTDEKVSRAA